MYRVGSSCCFTTLFCSHRQLYNKYPHMPVMLHLKSTKPPALEILPSSVDFTVVGQVDVYVTSPNKTSTAKLAFTIGIVRLLSQSNHLEPLTVRVKHHVCMVGVTGTSLQCRPLGFYQWDKRSDQS